MLIWIVEASAFRNGGDAFEAAVVRSGGQLRWLAVEDEFRGRYGRWDEGDRVIFRGSFEAAENFRRLRPDGLPGVIGQAGDLRCSSYYPVVGPYLLNDTHTFCRLRDLRGQWSTWVDQMGSALFVRPDSGAKAFTGQVVLDFDRFEARERPYLDAMAADERVVVAPLKAIQAEWRLVIIGGKVVAGSRYKFEGRRDVSAEVPLKVRAFAQDVAGNIAPPAVAYMLDVAKEDSGRLSVVELNSFSCSDLYVCEPLAVVKALQELLGHPA